MMTFVRALRAAVLTATAIGLAGAVPNAAAASRSGTTVLALTPPVRAVLERVRIRVLYPAVVPASLEGVGIAVDAGTNNAYSLDVVASRRCIGVNTAGGACTQATVEGQRPVGPTPRGYVPVRLPGGTRGYYHVGVCGANCEGSFQLTFVRWNARYVIGIKAGTLADGLAVVRGLRVLR